MKWKIVLAILISTLMMGSIFTSAANVKTNISTMNVKTNDGNNPCAAGSGDITTVNIGTLKMKFIKNKDKNYVDISFVQSTIEKVWYDIGDTIRIETNWEIVEGALLEGGGAQDYWNFSIPEFAIHKCGSVEWRSPENEEGWFVEIFDTEGHNDSSSGTVYFDFTPTREWSCHAIHKTTSYSIDLNCEYKRRAIWYVGQYDTTEVTFDIGEDLCIEYRNSKPNIESYYYAKDGKELTLYLNVTDLDCKTTGFLNGDYLGAYIDWGNGSIYETNQATEILWLVEYDSVKGCGVAQISKSHTYVKGTYTITAKVKDWYNGIAHGWGDYSNPITIKDIPVSVSKLVNRYADNLMFTRLLERFSFLESLFPFLDGSYKL